MGFFDACIGTRAEGELNIGGRGPVEREGSIPQEVLHKRSRQRGGIGHPGNVVAHLLLAIVAHHLGGESDLRRQPIDLIALERSQDIAPRLDPTERLDRRHYGRIIVGNAGLPVST